MPWWERFFPWLRRYVNSTWMWRVGIFGLFLTICHYRQRWNLEGSKEVKVKLREKLMENGDDSWENCFGLGSLCVTYIDHIILMTRSTWPAMHVHIPHIIVFNIYIYIYIVCQFKLLVEARRFKEHDHIMTGQQTAPNVPPPRNKPY